eukprot:8579888-Pyramimonas_sp.AAC.1
MLLQGAMVSARVFPGPSRRSAPRTPQGTVRGRRVRLSCTASPPPSSGKEQWTGSFHNASAVQQLRDLLASPGIHQGPCCHDGISAKLIDRAGFPFAFMSGYCVSGARIGAPDAGLMSYHEM